MSLFLAKFILTVAFGFNMRIANIQPNPTDYQFKIQSRTTAGEFECKYERENGALYKGLFIRSAEIYRSYVEIKIDQADNISKQYLYKNIFSLPTNQADDILMFRTLYQWNEWKDPTLLGGIEINFDTGQITTRYELDSNLTDSMVSRLNFEYKWLEGEVWYLMPYIRHELYSDKFGSFKGKRSWNVGFEYGIDYVEMLRLRRSE